MQFSEKYTKHSDVESAEAMFQFIDSLQPSVQAWVRTQQPVDLQSAMQIAEQVGSTLTTATYTDKRGLKCPVDVPVAVK